MPALQEGYDRRRNPVNVGTTIALEGISSDARNGDGACEESRRCEMGDRGGAAGSGASSSMIGFRNALEFVIGLAKATLKPRPRIPVYKWADDNVRIPDEAGGPHPGQLRTSRFPIFRGLFDLTQKRGVHFVTLCASARVGKTLFSIILVLYWIAERVGSVVWLDPSGQSAKKFVRNELEHFLRLCPPVISVAVFAKAAWQILWKTFRGKNLRIVGSGAEADMHGFNAELAIINEADRCREATTQDASSRDKIIARTRLYPHTRLIVENSTPGAAGEFSPIWHSFLRGSQHHCYLPCPHCSDDAAARGEQFKLPATQPVGWSSQSADQHLAGWQRLTFAVEKKLVPFNDDLSPLVDETGKLLPREKWREEITGQIKFSQFAIWKERPLSYDATRTERYKAGYDYDAVERGATYECAHCKREIPFVKLRWMLARYRWVAHNPEASSDTISAHVWAGYSPFEGWGIIAREFIGAKSDIGSLIKFHNFTLGLPFIRQGAAVKGEDLDRVIARTPVRYTKGQLPMRPERLTMTIDKQHTEFWFVIRAWGIRRDTPEMRTWSALVDWGRAYSYNELLEIAGHKRGADGHLRSFVWTDDEGTVNHDVFCGLVDAGDTPDSVYSFCARETDAFDVYKGAGPNATRGARIRVTKVFDEEVTQWLCWSDFWASNLYDDCIKFGSAFGQPVDWWLPVDIDDDYRKQLTDEYRTNDGWQSRSKNNHLGDCEKMTRCLSEKLEATFEELREEILEKAQVTPN